MKRKKDADTLFDQEKKVLESALTNLMRDDYKEHPLFEAYQSLTHHYEKLLRQSRKLLRISDSQYNLLQKVENDIRILLNHAGQGFLSFGPDLTVNRQYSEECVRIFGQKIENVNIIDLLLAPEETELRDLFARVFCEVFQDTELSEKESQLNRLPAQMLINDRFINLDYRVVSGLTDNKSEGLIMLILTDITEKQAAEAQIHFLSYHDSLTGVYNRAYIDSIIDKLDREEELPLSMIMADVNGLKLTNDVFGHQAGDRLLRNLAQLLVKCLRSHDPVARWGGDEFLILLPRTGEDVLALITERINASCHSADPDPIPLSVAIGAATRHSMKESLADLFRRAEDLMYSHKLKESQQVRRYIVDSLNNNLAARSFESKEHIQRVKDMALALGYRLGLNQQEKKELEMLALLHDIGMITVPDGIINKAGKLTPAEWEVVHKHSEVGFRMAQSIGEYKLAEYIMAHHERWDGSGYPLSLKGDSIPLASRIIALADAYDVMTSERPYRPALSVQEAQRELAAQAGTQFDPELVGTFLEMDLGK